MGRSDVPGAAISDCFLQIAMEDGSGRALSPTRTQPLALHYADMPLVDPNLALELAGGAKYGTTVVRSDAEREFDPIAFRLSATHPAASVWLETPLAGRWSDNAMHVTNETVSVSFIPWEATSADEVLRSTSVWSVNTL